MAKRKKDKTEAQQAPVTPSEPEQPKRKVGRPSDYDPSMCDRILEMGAEGFAVIEMAVGLNVTKQTLYKWAKDETKPEFSDALTRARQLAEAHHAAIYRKGCGLPANMFNAAGYAKYMGIVFADWREITRTEITGAEGGPIETKEVSPRELAQRAAFVIQRGIDAATTQKPH